MRLYWSNYYKNGGRSPNIGRNHTQETKDKISKGNKNKKRTQEFKDAISNRMRGREPWNKGIKTPRSNETKEKLRSMHLKWFNNGVIEVHVCENEVPKNFIKGRLNSFKSNKEALNKRNDKMRNKIWMNNGITSRMIDKNEVPIYENNGWVKGRKLVKNN